jgi:general secretion pathway protein C
MKRLPLIINIILFALLCMVLSYWGMQIFKPKVRPIAVSGNMQNFEPNVGQWGSIFGFSETNVAAVSSYQLKGVIVAPQARDSAAIIYVEGEPTFSIGIGKEFMPGVKLQEVHTNYVVVSESGVAKRVDLPATAAPIEVAAPQEIKIIQPDFARIGAPKAIPKPIP